MFAGIFKNIIGSNGEENFEKLSFEDLLKKASSVDLDNKNIQKKLKSLNEENILLKNSIIKSNNHQNSEFSNFLKLSEKNLLNSQDNNGYSIDNFKKFLYDNNLFYGTLEENDINYLKNREINWDNEKENYLLKQEILQKNLKALYSNLFVPKAHEYKKNVIKKEKKENNKEEEKIDNNKKKENKKDIYKKFNDNFKKKEDKEEINIYENILLENDSENS